MLKKTLSIFHASNIVLWQQCRNYEYKKYSDLISCLLITEKNNELIMKNHQAHPIGEKSFLEANAFSYAKAILYSHNNN